MSIDLKFLVADDESLDTPTDHLESIAHLFDCNLASKLPIPVMVNGEPHKLFLSGEETSETCNIEDTFIHDEERAEWREFEELLESTHYIIFAIINSDNVAVAFGHAAMVFTEGCFTQPFWDLDGYIGGFDILLRPMDRVCEDGSAQGLHVVKAYFHPKYRHAKAISEILGATSQVAHGLNRRGYNGEAEYASILSHETDHHFTACQHATNVWHICDKTSVLFRIPIPQEHLNSDQTRVNYKHLLTWSPVADKEDTLKEIMEFSYPAEQADGMTVSINGKPHWLGKNEGFENYAFVRSIIVNEKLDVVCACSFIVAPNTLEISNLDFLIDEDGNEKPVLGTLHCLTEEGCNEKQVELFTQALAKILENPKASLPLLVIDQIHLHPAYRDEKTIKDVFKALLASVSCSKRDKEVGVIVTKENSFRSTLLGISKTFDIEAEDACLAIVSLRKRRTPKRPEDGQASTPV